MRIPYHQLTGLVLVVNYNGLSLMQHCNVHEELSSKIVEFKKRDRGGFRESWVSKELSFERVGFGKSWVSRECADVRCCGKLMVAKCIQPFFACTLELQMQSYPRYCGAQYQHRRCCRCCTSNIRMEALSLAALARGHIRTYVPAAIVQNMHTLEVHCAAQELDTTPKSMFPTDHVSG
jgi:hypothetical protein